MAKKDSREFEPGQQVEETQSADAAMWERFKKIETDRFMFNPNRGCSGALVGYLINEIPMPPIQRGKNPKTGEPIMQDWECFVIYTTETCKGIDREGNVIDVAKGKEVLVPATFQLGQHFTRVAGHPKLCWEVIISPKRKIEIGNGQTMWLYDLGANPNGAKERREFGANAILAAPDAPKALPVGQATAEGAGQAGDDQIPF
jgi:hypothetical protein